MSAHSRTITFIVTLVLAFSLVGCQGGPQQTPTQAMDLAYTQAAETIVAELTQNAPPGAQEVEPDQTEESLPPTSTLAPTETFPPTSTPVPTETPFPTDTATPAASPTSTVPPEPQMVLAYQDDFSTNQVWTIAKESTFRFHYTRGGYMMENNVEKEIVFSVRGEPYSDTRMEVTGSRVEGPFDGYYGLVCRFSNGGNYYFLAVGSDGWYGIGMKQSNLIKFLVEGNDTTKVNTGIGKNRIRGDCIGDMLTLYVNDVKVAQVKDLTFSAGTTGLMVGTRKVAGYNALFDDFALYLPQQ